MIYLFPDFKGQYHRCRTILRIFSATTPSQDGDPDTSSAFTANMARGEVE